MSTNWLVSAGFISCYPALMVNFILFIDEKCSSCQHHVIVGHKIIHLAIQKLNCLASGFVV